MAKKSPNTLGDTLSQLESLISRMEEEGLSLEDSLAAFEQGIKLSRKAQKALEEAEQRVSVLANREEEPELKSFPDEESK